MPRGKMKKSNGQTKVETKRIEDTQERFVCFSKRKNAIFTHASDLTTLCGGEVAIVLFSPAENPLPYSFGNPTIDTVIDRFLSGKPSKFEPELGQVVEESPTVRALRQEMQDLTKRIEMEKAKKVALKATLKEVATITPENKLLTLEDGDLGLPELERLKNLLEEIKLKANERMVKLKARGDPSSSNAPLGVSPVQVQVWNPFDMGQFPLFRATG